MEARGSRGSLPYMLLRAEALLLKPQVVEFHLYRSGKGFKGLTAAKKCHTFYSITDLLEFFQETDIY